MVSLGEFGVEYKTIRFDALAASALVYCFYLIFSNAVCFTPEGHQFRLCIQVNTIKPTADRRTTPPLSQGTRGDRNQMCRIQIEFSIYTKCRPFAFRVILFLFIYILPSQLRTLGVSVRAIYIRFLCMYIH